MPKVVLKGVDSVAVAARAEDVMSDRMIFCPKGPMSRPDDRAPLWCLPNWKWVAGVDLGEGLSRPVEPPQLEVAGQAHHVRLVVDAGHLKPT